MRLIAVRAICLSLFLLLASPVSAALAYNGAAAATYADQYWSSYNSQWPSFANKGGDCTNFVSQALNAGGLSMRTSPQYSGNAAWYMLKSHSKWSWSTSWVNAQDNSNFLTNYLGGVAQVASYVGVPPGQVLASNASQGDVVLYDWTNDGTFDHEAIITASDDNGASWDLVDAHTNNRYHAYWTLAQYNSSWMTTRIVVFHIPASAY